MKKRLRYSCNFIEFHADNVYVSIFFRKLVVYDEESSIAVYVAMDNTVVIENIMQLCKSKPKREYCQDSQKTAQKTDNITKAKDDFAQFYPDSCRSNAEQQTKQVQHQQAISQIRPVDKAHKLSDSAVSVDPDWRPLLLIVPLRLGLSHLNTVYSNALKVRVETPYLVYCLTVYHIVTLIKGTFKI